MNNNTYVDKLIQKRNKYSNFKSSSSTGHKGVTIHNGKYRSYFSFRTSNKHIKLHLGVYNTIEEAINARNKFIDSLK